MKDTRVNREQTILNSIGYAFEKLDPSKSAESQVDSFLADIKMCNQELIRSSYLVASRLEYNHITTTYVVSGLYELYPMLERRNIRKILMDNFRDWLLQYPDLDKIYPKLSFAHVLKVFAKSVS